MRIYLIYNDSIVHSFDAVDEAEARIQTAAFVRQKMISVILAVARRRITVTPPVPPAPTVDDQPA